MILSWLKRRRRRKLLAGPLPPEWLDLLHRNVAHYRYLTPAEQARLRDDARVMVAEKHWEGCGGLAVNDEMKVTIAGQAAVLLVGLEHDYFPNVLSVLIYPTGYSLPERPVAHGLLVEEDPELLGEAVHGGPVVLSWEDVLWDSQHPGEGENLVWHEFAHKLDMLDREINGTPPLGSREASLRWHEVMTAEFQRLSADARTGRPTLLDEYGAEDEAEFFAVATETFFDRPHAMARRHPQLYELLRDYYRQDPAARLPRLSK